MAQVAGIYRYPIKGLTAQSLHRVELEAGRPFSFDRVFALSRSNRHVDPQNPQWAKKGLFVMLMLEEALATVRTYLDLETLRLSVTSAAGRPLLSADLNDAEGRHTLETFIEQLVPKLPGRPAVPPPVDETSVSSLRGDRVG